MKKRIFAFICIFILLCLLIAFLIIRPQHPKEKNQLPFDGSAEEWHGFQDVSNGDSEMEMIEIPGFESLVFYNSQKSQKVNFYNPSKNKCLLKFSLLVDDKLVWESGYVEPNKGYYNISVEPMPIGEYIGIMQVECFRDNGTQLNGANMEIKVIYKE